MCNNNVIVYFLTVWTLRICSDDVHVAYIDGKKAYNGTRKIINSVLVAHNTKVIAILAKNTEGAGGFKAASTDNKIVTDESWKCLSTFIEGWQSVNFDDGSWPVAAATGDTSGCVGFPSSAKWLWTNFKYNTIETAYCRKTLSKTIKYRNKTIKRSNYCILRL